MVDDSLVVKVFGEIASEYLPCAKDIISKVDGQSYFFMDTAPFEEIAFDADRISETNQIYWTELLGRTHLAATTSIQRNLSWIEGAARSYEDDNFLSFAANLRGLIESVGDAMEVLVPSARFIAKHHSAIKSAVQSKLETIFISDDFEKSLIHYSHARRVKKSDDAPEEHKAKQTFHYINILAENAAIPAIKPMYADLCSIMHPAAMSVLCFVENGDDRENGVEWRNSPSAYTFRAQDLRGQYEETLPYLVFQAFDPAFITLRALHRFEMFPQLSGLKNFSFRLRSLIENVDSDLRK
ncbi:hypothetical protein L2D14_05735 [Thalassospiraceae bacterium LMO-JJ14]|nr:hypothetical protein L2D14_05735 [Thalassospiraceae bacterium LMO-JJ14]